MTAGYGGIVTHASTVTLEDLLAPGRALESLTRRSAHGHRPALRLLLEHAPAVIEAEERWIYPALLRRRPGGVRRSWLLPHAGEHEQILELLGHLSRGGSPRLDPMLRAAQWLLLRHARSERAWFEAVLSVPRPRLEDRAFTRFVTACHPLVATMRALQEPGRDSGPLAPRAAQD